MKYNGSNYIRIDFTTQQIATKHKNLINIIRVFYVRAACIYVNRFFFLLWIFIVQWHLCCELYLVLYTYELRHTPTHTHVFSTLDDVIVCVAYTVYLWNGLTLSKLHTACVFTYFFFVVVGICVYALCTCVRVRVFDEIINKEKELYVNMKKKYSYYYMQYTVLNTIKIIRQAGFDNLHYWIDFDIWSSLWLLSVKDNSIFSFFCNINK